MNDIVFRETELKIENIIPNPNNPRKHFDESKLEELAASIAEVGILQPLVVTDGEDGKYLLVAGERRFRAAQMAGLLNVPVIYRSKWHLQGEDMMQAAMLIENLQREDLDPIEEAKAFAVLTRDHGWKQTELAEKLGVSQAHIANRMRLLQLPEKVQEKISQGEVTASTGKELATLTKVPAVKKYLEKEMEKGQHTTNLIHMAKHTAHEATRPLFKMSHPEPKFQLKPCEKCNERVMLPDRWGESENKKPHCLNVKCWEGKQKQAEEDAQEKARQQVLATGKEIINLSDLPYDAYENFLHCSVIIDTSDCQECEHYRYGRNKYMDESESIKVCLNPSCFKAKKTAAEKQERQREKLLKAALEELKEELIAEYVPVIDYEESSEFDALVYIAAQAIQNPPYSATMSKSKLEQAVYERFCLEKPEGLSWKAEAKHLVEQLSNLSAKELLQLTFFAMVKPADRDNRIFEAVYGSEEDGQMDGVENNLLFVPTLPDGSWVRMNENDFDLSECDGCGFNAQAHDGNPALPFAVCTDPACYEAAKRERT